MSEYTITMHIKPQPKQRARVTKHGTYTPPETVAFEQNIGWEYKLNGGKMLHGPISLECTFTFKIPKSRKDVRPGDWHSQRPDSDNLVKCVSDGLNGVAFEDDCQIVHSVAWKMWGVEDMVQITVREVKQYGRDIDG